MADALPRGWSGNVWLHKRRIGLFQIEIRSKNYGRKIGRRWWFLITATAEKVIVPDNRPSEMDFTVATPEEARRAALTALLALLTTATREAEEAVAGLET